MILQHDADWMEQALQLARQAAAENQVPVGAVLVAGNGELLGSGYNHHLPGRRIGDHAEMLAIRQANSQADHRCIAGATIYVTLEPCLMCLGAIVQARIARLVFGAHEPKTGAVISRYQLGDNPAHQIDWHAGVLGNRCGELMTAFFRQKRQTQKVSSA